MSTGFIQFDRAATYIPGVSTIVNLPEVIYKAFITNELSKEASPSDSIRGYLAEKSLIRCIVSLIPILGNLALIAFDLLELVKNREKEAPTTGISAPLGLTENISQLIEAREKVDAEFEEILPLAIEILKEGQGRLTPKLEKSTKMISNVINLVDRTKDQCDLCTKKIITFRGNDDDYLGKIIDTIALSVIVYMGLGLTGIGLCGAAITLKIWSVFRGKS